MNDSHATVVTKYFAKITILFLQCTLLRGFSTCTTNNTPWAKKATCTASAFLGKYASIANPVEETGLLKQVGTLLRREQGLLHIQNRGVGVFTRVALILENWGTLYLNTVIV